MRMISKSDTFLLFCCLSCSSPPVECCPFTFRAGFGEPSDAAQTCIDQQANLPGLHDITATAARKHFVPFANCQLTMFSCF